MMNQSLYYNIWNQTLNLWGWYPPPPLVSRLADVLKELGSLKVKWCWVDGQDINCDDELRMITNLVVMIAMKILDHTGRLRFDKKKPSH